MPFCYIFLLNIPKYPKPYIDYLIIAYPADMYHMQPYYLCASSAEISLVLKNVPFKSACDDGY